MLVVKPRGGGGRHYQYGGSGIFDTLSRTLLSSSMKSAINTAAKSAVAQKVANAVVNGATSATETAVKDLVNNTTKRVKSYIAGKKRPQDHQQQIPASEVVGKQEVKKSKIDFDSLVNGSGIVLD